MSQVSSKELFRKSIHISSLAIPMLYKYLFHYNRRSAFLLLIPLTVLFIVFDTFRIEHRTFKRFYHNVFGIIIRKHELSDFTGAVYVMVSAVLSIALFPGDIAFMSLSFLAIGDTLAAIVGIRLGKRKLKGQNKSLEGSIACFLGTFIFGLGYYIFDYDGQLSLAVICLGAISATLAEAWKMRFDDNLKIPLISGFIMYLSSLLF